MSDPAPIRPRKVGPGRRGTGGDTRQAILAAGRELFAANGFAGTTVRGIAATAGVDPALVIHYFGTKAELFSEVLTLPEELPAKLLAAIAGDPAGLGERLTRAYLQGWEEPGTSAFLRATFRSLVTNDEALRVIRGFLETTLLRQVAPALGGDESRPRIALAAAQLFGVAVGRHIVAAAPLTALSVDELTALIAPGIQALLVPGGSPERNSTGVDTD